MSQYPPPPSFGYGLPQQGQQSSQPAFPHNPYVYPGYHASPYPSAFASPAQPFTQQPVQVSQASQALQASFAYNATHIPGLGMANAPHGVAAFNPWTQAAPIPPPVTSTSTAQASPSTSFISQQSETMQSAPAVSALSNQPAKPSNPATPVPPVSTSRIAYEVEIEEGELSEGQFEDLYEPQESGPKPTQSTPKLSRTVNPSQPTSAVDTPDGGFYSSSDEDDGPKAAELAAENRDRSASYSPFLSPREGSRASTSQPPLIKETVANGNHAAPSGEACESWNAKHNSQPSVNFSESQSGQNAPATYLNSFGSLQEARKAAQKALLRLRPLGLSFKTYIEEGFDEQVIRNLFRDLQFKTDEDLTGVQPTPAQQQNEGSKATKPGQAVATLQPTFGSKVATAQQTQDQATKGEERKDRIARLLAEKAAKGSAKSVTASPSAPVKPTTAETKPQTQQGSMPTATPPTGPKGRVWGEKERILQQKILALQKSREAQAAQKSTPSKAEPAPAQGSQNGSPVPPQQWPNAPSGPSSTTIPTGPRASSAQSLVGIQTAPAPSQAPPSLPGLATPTNTQPNPAAQRKRPVAADFVDYSASSKRPYGHVRNDNSFIIDVSDASDDEEMDMDMGSPVEEAPPSQPVANRGPSMREFPPRTETFTHRQISSPVPSLTPSGLNNKRRETELDLKEKAIQEMKKKIALAEARRKAKQAVSGSATPNQVGVGTPSSEKTSESSSTSLSKSSDAAKVDSEQQVDRRGQIRNIDLPRVESSLEEKLRRLRQLREEEAQLQAEINKALAEKKQLADELEHLEKRREATPQLTTSESSVDSGLNKGQSNGHPSNDRKTGYNARPPAEGLPTGATTTAPQPAPETSAGGDEAVTPTAAARSDRAESNAPVTADSSVGGSTLVAAAAAEAEVASTLAPAASAGGDDSSPGTSQPNHEGRADETESMDLESRSSSPTTASVDQAVQREASGAGENSGSVPQQISVAAQPREEAQELEVDTAGEVKVVSRGGVDTDQLTDHQVSDERGSKQDNTALSYSSPLRFFRNFRFHPEFTRLVAGGWRSLTYSSRIDPDKEMCPYELEGTQCPSGCSFQHFVDITPADERILLELSNSDMFDGEDKVRFVEGLRALLHRFKADKIRDFETIARGIIEYRFQHIGDRSKLLPLDGVSI